MTHRGPDDEGYYIEGSVGLGMRRLSIIDLQTGHQPIFNEDRSIALVFNGEIYNFNELRADLENRGHRFRTRSDTEVIVHLYEEKGKDCLDELNGMFAFALYDLKRNEVFLARDRVGIKPLYYAISDHSLMFASEIKALVDAGCERTIDPASLASYLRFKYVPSPRTVFRKVQKLPPGHAAVFKDGKLKVSRYWSASTENRWEAGAARASEHLRMLLEDSVRLRLISDVPVGVFLCGGLDSSIITALAAKMSDHPVKTFSLGFREQQYDETKHAREVALSYGTDHREEVIVPRMTDCIPELIWHMDEPVADPSLILSYHVSRLASEQVKVVLLGDGSDELFAGYTRYSLDHLLGYYARVPAPIRKHLFDRVAHALPSSETNGLTRVLKRLRSGLLRAGEDPLNRYLSTLSVFDKPTQDALFGHAVGSQGDPAQPYREIFQDVSKRDSLSQIQHIDINTYLPEDLLLKADKMTMAHSIEGRFPFLDHRVVEFAATLPANLKMRFLVKKYVLRQAFRDVLPASVLRRRKQGFGIPVQKWLRSDLREMVHDLLLDRNALYLGHLSGDVTKGILSKYDRGADELYEQVWSMFTLELWLRKFTGSESR